MDIQPHEWISSREMNKRVPIDTTAKIDPDASHVVGHAVRVNDPRLIALCVKWKRKMNLDPDGIQSYNFYHQTGFIEELKQTFNGEA